MDCRTPTTFPALDSNSSAAPSSASPGQSRPATSPASPSRIKFEAANGERTRPKQKRNKPTLSCEECVERKTKCDRGRPTCLACGKRQSECVYTHVANLIASADQSDSPGGNAGFLTRPPSKIRKTTHGSPDGAREHVFADANSSRHRATSSRKSRSLSVHSPSLLSQLPFSSSTPSNIFGIGSQHPFANYWTCAGGVPELVGVLPSKDQADMLVAKFFEVVDPVYPFVHRRSFYLNYEKFWAAPLAVKHKADADLLAMHYTVYALGTQFMALPSYAERTSSAEFYASAATQALRVYSYLNRTSMRAIAAMLLLAYFLMNDNHASDAYAWAGILLRQAYAMRLHRDPDIAVPDVLPVEKQARRKLWQAVFFQDTFLTVLLKLPPTATHSDVAPDSLVDESVIQPGNADLDNSVRAENLMSISVIAPPHNASTFVHLQPHHLIDPLVDRTDCDFIRSMWKLGTLVQEHLSSPLSLSLPLANSPRRKSSIISSFRSLYRSFPAFLTMLDSQVLQMQAATNPRGVRQNLFLTSNYHHCLMLLQAMENEQAGVECNVRGALEAAHEAIWAFFKLHAIFEAEARVWWVFQHRAFEEALTIASLLAIPLTADTNFNDALYTRCKEDLLRMRDLLLSGSGSIEMQATRSEVLQAAIDRIIVI